MVHTIPGIKKYCVLPFADMCLIIRQRLMELHIRILSPTYVTVNIILCIFLLLPLADQITKCKHHPSMDRLSLMYAFLI